MYPNSHIVNVSPLLVEKVLSFTVMFSMSEVREAL